MLIPEVAVLRDGWGSQQSWQAELRPAREQLSRQTAFRSLKDPTPNVLLNLLKVIYIREWGYVKRKTWGHGGVRRARRRVTGCHCVLNRGLLDLLDQHLFTGLVVVRHRHPTCVHSPLLDPALRVAPGHLQVSRLAPLVPT